MQFEHLPIQKKLTRFILLISILILFVTGVIFFANDYFSYKQSSIEKVETVGKIIATNSTAAVVFNSQEDAFDVISAVAAEPNITAVCIYDLQGELFSYYPEGIETKLKLTGTPKYDHEFSNGSLNIYLPIKEGENELGVVFIKYDMSGIYSRIKIYLLIVLLTMVISLFLVWVFSFKLRKTITKPILSLASTAVGIGVAKDFSIRATKHFNDEVGQLTDSFNKMVAQIEEQNKVVSNYNNDLIEKAKQLELASKYKSEFLANMSHELRSPLNSLLILSADLAKNRRGNLNEEEQESISIIYDSGSDLLNLINDILDLSKIEAGKMEANMESIKVAKIKQAAKNSFKPLADKKNIDFIVKTGPGVPDRFISDEQRLNQILKNLLSNAIKFTSKGAVTLDITRDGDNLHFAVIDSGIGIPKEKQGLIFEAFKQAEGGTSRRYGGTGLGLSIASQLAELLGGKLHLESEENRGSTFSLILPLNNEAVKTAPQAKMTPDILDYTEAEEVEDFADEFVNVATIDDDRDNIVEGDKTVLIIEDDLPFAKILREEARAFGFKSISAGTGEDGLKLAEEYHPQAIILDLKLPGISGLTVLGILKSRLDLRHIPVHIISSLDQSETPIKSGVLNYLSKPISREELKFAFRIIEDYISREVKNLLIVEDEENVRQMLTHLLKKDDVNILECDNVQDGLRILKEKTIDCILLDLKLADGSGMDIVEASRHWEDYKLPPIVVYTGKDLSKKEINSIKQWAESIIIKGHDSENRLLNETSLYLHSKVNELPEEKREMLNEGNDIEVDLSGKKVWIVDDDMRNIFALTKSLRAYHIDVYKAGSGVAALSLLEENPNIEMVLMDIMMPEMDGYEAMDRVRKIPGYNHVPIIALTAKAMAEDRKKCLDAGASDYFAKPVDVEKLLKLMRIWLK